MYPFSEVDFPLVMDPHDHVVALSVRAVDIGKRRVIAIGKQDIAWKKQSDDRLQQTALPGLFATLGGYRDKSVRAFTGSDTGSGIRQTVNPESRV